MSPTEFLLARIAEDEEVARAATQGPWIFDGQGFASPGGEPFIRAPYHELDISEEDEEHIVRWRPHRVLAKCAADRRIVALADAAFSPDVDPVAEHHAGNDGPWVGSVTLKLLALPYADHPDYDERWRP